MGKIKKLLLFLFFLLGNIVYSQNLEYTLFTKISDERLTRSLESQGSAEFEGPSGIAFDRLNNLYIANGWEGLLLKYSAADNSLSIVFDPEKPNAVIYATSLYTNNGTFGGTIGYRFGWFNQTSGYQYNIDLGQSSISSELEAKAFYMSEKYFFHYLKDGGIICIPHPSLDNSENLRKILRNEEVLTFFKDTPTSELDGLTIDENYNLFLNGKIANTDYFHLATYWARNNGYSDFEKYLNDSKNKSKPAPLDVSTIMTFLGTDRSGNTYFIAYNQILLVFNKQGWCIKQYNYRNASLLPTIDSDGNIYLFRYGRDDDHTIEIYKSTNWPE